MSGRNRLLFGGGYVVSLLENLRPFLVRSHRVEHCLVWFDEGRLDAFHHTDGIDGNGALSIVPEAEPFSVGAGPVPEDGGKLGSFSVFFFNEATNSL
jgi:hypothetical protein